MANRTINRYEATKVKNVGCVPGPDGGVAMVVEFDRVVTIDGNNFVFPLIKPQMVTLWKILTGIVSEQQLENIEVARAMQAINQGKIKLS